MMEILVTLKEVYGSRAVYPACEKAEEFAAIAETKPLTDRTIESVKRLGYTVTIARDLYYEVDHSGEAL